MRRLLRALAKLCRVAPSRARRRFLFDFPWATKTRQRRRRAVEAVVAAATVPARMGRRKPGRKWLLKHFVRVCERAHVFYRKAGG